MLLWKVGEVGMKVLIAVPCFDMVHTDFMRCLIDLEKPEGTVYTVIKNTLIYNARNTIAANAVKMGFDRIMWFDSDVTFEPDTLVKLSEDMDRTGADIVTGLYFTRKTPTKPVIFDNLVYKVQDDGLVQSGATYYEEYPKDELFPVEGCGFGCVMTSVELINQLGQRYGAPFTPLFGIGEDLSFCHRARREGAGILCDSRIKCGHIGTMEFNEQTYLHQIAP